VQCIDTERDNDDLSLENNGHTTYNDGSSQVESAEIDVDVVDLFRLTNGNIWDIWPKDDFIRKQIPQTQV